MLLQLLLALLTPARRPRKKSASWRCSKAGPCWSVDKGKPRTVRARGNLRRRQADQRQQRGSRHFDQRQAAAVEDRRGRLQRRNDTERTRDGHSELRTRAGISSPADTHQRRSDAIPRRYRRHHGVDGRQDARRAGVNYLEGTRGHSQTANGVTPVYRVKLEQREAWRHHAATTWTALVHENNSLPVVLLGMSFLGQLEMRREGESLTLTKRY